MKYVEISINRCKVYLTEEEILTLLRKDINLYKRGLQRGKAFIRSKKQKEREYSKYNSEAK